MSLSSYTVTRRSPSPARSITVSSSKLHNRSAMVRETVKAYSSKLPAPTESKQTKYRPQEDQHQEIMELKRSLAQSRHDHQITKVQCRRQDEVINRKAKLLDSIANEQEDGRMERENLVSSLSGSLDHSGRPSLNRELVAKLRSMTETIKMLSLENGSLRDENDTLREENIEYENTTKTEDVRNVWNHSDEKVQLILGEYEKKLTDMTEQVNDLNLKLEVKDNQQPLEKDKYKSLARRLKDERNSYRDMVDEKKREQEELQVEIEKMSELIGELRRNCQDLQGELMAARQLPSPVHKSDMAIQTHASPLHTPKSPLSRKSSLQDASMRRDSLTENSPLSQKTRSTNSVAVSPRKGSRAINAKDPSKIYKDTKTIPNGQINNQRKLPPSSKKKGPVIAKPVQRQQSPVKLPAAPETPQASPKTSKIPASPKISKIPMCASRIPGSPGSRIPTPSNGSPARSKIPNPIQYISPRKLSDGITPAKILQHIEEHEHNEILCITEDTETRNTSVVTTVGPDDSLPPPPLELESHIEIDFPPPPKEPPPTLPKPPKVDINSQTLPMPSNNSDQTESPIHEMRWSHETPTWPQDTPRTQKKVDNLRQAQAARKIQRTWKQFYDELEVKGSDDPLRTLERQIGKLKQDVTNGTNHRMEAPIKTPTPSTITTESRENMRLIEEEHDRDEAISVIQSALAGHQVRSAALAAARSRGGIYTARPWVVASSDEEEDSWVSVQGILRAHSKRSINLKNLEMNSQRASGRVSSNNRSDGATDDDDDVMCT